MPTTAVLRRLARECLQFPGRIGAAVASLLVLSAAQLYLTWIAKLWADELVDGSGGDDIPRLLLLGAAVTTVMASALFASRYLLASVNQALLGRLRDAIQAKLLRAELAAVRGFPAGDLASRAFNDVGVLSGFTEMALKRVIGEGFLLAGAVAMMLWLEWRLTLAALVMGPPLVAVMAQFGRSVRRRGLLAQEEIGAVTAMFTEQIGGLSTIKGFGAERFESDRFAERNLSYRRRAVHADAWSALLGAAVILVTGLGLLAVIRYGSHLVASGRMTSGGLLSFCLYAVQAIEPARRMSEVVALMQRMAAAATRVFEVIDLPWVESGGTRSLAKPVRGEIEVDGVSFRYPVGRSVLAALDLRIEPGEAIALVATSGGGKSTLAALLQRFYDPSEGTIRLDGVDLRELSLDELRRAVCVVEQDAFVFAGSLADNVRYGSWEASRGDVERAIALAGLETFAHALPGGLDGELREGGRNLSGGQRQRIALARAIVREPAVLVLDEATSALDGDTEAQIFAKLDRWLAGRTVVVMAHRLSTVTRFPRVLVLEDGRLVAEGSAADLERTCPPFRRLFAEQLAPLGRDVAVAR